MTRWVRSVAPGGDDAGDVGVLGLVDRHSVALLEDHHLSAALLDLGDHGLRIEVGAVVVVPEEVLLAGVLAGAELDVEARRKGSWPARSGCAAPRPRGSGSGACRRPRRARKLLEVGRDRGDRAASERSRTWKPASIDGSASRHPGRRPPHVGEVVAPDGVPWWANQKSRGVAEAALDWSARPPAARDPRCEGAGVAGHVGATVALVEVVPVTTLFFHDRAHCHQLPRGTDRRFRRRLPHGEQQVTQPHRRGKRASVSGFVGRADLGGDPAAVGEVPAVGARPLADLAGARPVAGPGGATGAAAASSAHLAGMADIGRDGVPDFAAFLLDRSISYVDPSRPKVTVSSASPPSMSSTRMMLTLCAIADPL